LALGTLRDAEGAWRSTDGRSTGRASPMVEYSLSQSPDRDLFPRGSRYGFKSRGMGSTTVNSPRIRRPCLFIVAHRDIMMSRSSGVVSGKRSSDVGGALSVSSRLLTISAVEPGEGGGRADPDQDAVRWNRRAVA